MILIIFLNLYFYYIPQKYNTAQYSHCYYLVYTLVFHILATLFLIKKKYIKLMTFKMMTFQNKLTAK